MQSMDVTHLFTLQRPALAPVRDVLAVGTAQSVGPLRGGDLA